MTSDSHQAKFSKHLQSFSNVIFGFHKFFRNSPCSRPILCISGCSFWPGLPFTVLGVSFEAVNFAYPIYGRRLTDSVIREIFVNSEESCSFESVEEEKCISYNYESSVNKTAGFKCQINNSDRFSSVAYFTKAEDFKYVGILSTCEKDSSPCGGNVVCIPNYQNDSVRCVCDDGYTGKPCEPIKHCAQLLKDGVTSSGVYTIVPDGGQPMPVFCDMTTDGGGWIVFQKRLNGSVDFYLNWTSYKNGFGDLNGEFWLGNDNLHRLTAADDVILRVDLEDFDGNITYAEYTTFKVANETDKYRLLIGGYNGTAGNSLTYHNLMQFSTTDNDNDLSPNGSCAIGYDGAWWYNWCHHSNLNGLYLKGNFSSDANGVTWKAFRGWHYSLKRTEMKVKPKTVFN